MITRKNTAMHSVHSDSTGESGDCRFRGDMFSFSQDLQYHIYEVHAQEEKKCKFCENSFNRIDDLQKHVADHHM